MKFNEHNGQTGTVVAVCCNPKPGLPKPVVDAIQLIEDHGVEGDYHAGKLVRHRYLAKKYPTQKNVRQVLIVEASTFSELVQDGIQLGPGMMGENMAVADLAVMQLPTGTHLAVGEALLEITEIRVPCNQLNGIDGRLLKAVTARADGQAVYKAGIMTRVLKGGQVRPGDQVTVVAS